MWFVTAARGNSYTLSHRLPLSNPWGEATVPMPSSGDSSAHAEQMGVLETVRGTSPHAWLTSGCFTDCCSPPPGSLPGGPTPS